ncbi:NAD-dependent succinate-semialdehyde dehydrogenase [Pelagibacterium luteolum]|uniref:Succinate-semialdehyde dehydrogenase / glutarate-semialdehyde dehydrogenase n=1 Tax=Pelagibacterium luteolum TaxID=440168 RepID=A0A1G7WQH3_9HYPH|nr:NAD-dependent succinate-semialdehyde dehydrogenase [Pelagibacterium luteolum]SDG74163.1 succinate-semialdehyde dehydrogenase / glutarate-semialdehyde dehydrogenase [Pelagibacterium luteolum]
MTLTAALTDKLKDPSLVAAGGFINGKWNTVSSRGKVFRVDNPATGEVLAQIPDLSTHATRDAIDAAYAAQPGWAAKSAKQRADKMKKLFQLMVENADDLATILTLEMGKPWAEARGEILYGASFIEWFAEEARRVYGDTMPGHTPDVRISVIKQPVGVVGTITPWNFPNAMIARKLAPALAVGCTVVCKPAAETPLSALAMARLIERAGFPAGVFNVVPGTDSAAIGQELCSNPKVAKISFTGSTNVGKILMRQCADGIKRMSMELGGNAPFIVFDDADVEAAVDGAIASKFRNAGQTCVCANRVYVQSGIHDAFVSRLKEKMADLKLGNGMEKGVNLGPLITDKAVAKVTELVGDATAKGADILMGGAPTGERTFYPPTLLVGATKDMRIAREEIFGPVAPVFKFETVAEAIELANATEFGLAAYFYAKDISKVTKVAEALEYGIVGINTGMISTETAPFGGIKQSGFGREGSKYGIEDYLNIKYLCLAV